MHGASMPKVSIIHTRVCITRFKTRSGDRFQGIWLAVGHMISYTSCTHTDTTVVLGLYVMDLCVTCWGDCVLWLHLWRQHFALLRHSLTSGEMCPISCLRALLLTKLAALGVNGCTWIHTASLASHAHPPNMPLSHDLVDLTFNTLVR